MVTQGHNSGSSSHTVQANLTSVTDHPRNPRRSHPRGAPISLSLAFRVCGTDYLPTFWLLCFVSKAYFLAVWVWPVPEGGLCHWQSLLFPLTGIPVYSIPGQLGGPIIKGWVIGCVRECEKKEKGFVMNTETVWKQEAIRINQSFPQTEVYTIAVEFS